MPSLLITDHTFSPLDVEEQILRPLGIVIDAQQCRTPNELIPVVKEVDAVLTQFSPVNADVIAAMQRVRVIVRYGIGVDNVDLNAARARGIPVCNVPDYCIDEVADHTLALLLATTRQLMPNCLGVRNGAWGLAVALPEMKALRDLTVGVVGFGRIGRMVVRRLMPFGCGVIVFDPAVSKEVIETSGASAATSLDEVLCRADVLTLHCPSTAETRRMLSAENFAKMKRGSILINVARGDLVDTHAMTAALENGHLAAVALDVADPEPLPADHPLLRSPNALVTPHVASTSIRAVRNLRETAANLVARALRGEPLPNVVNGITP